MDPKQHQIIHLWYPTQRTQNGSHLRRKLYRHLRNVQESCWIIHCYVQKKSFPPLVYRRRNGRNGIHWSWIKHERFSVWILTILRCYRWRRKRIWRRRRRSCLIIDFLSHLLLNKNLIFFNNTNFSCINIFCVICWDYSGEGVCVSFRLLCFLQLFIIFYAGLNVKIKIFK